MAIPDYQNIMLSLLRFAGDGQVHSTREAIEFLAEKFDLSTEDRKELLPSGRASTQLLILQAGYSSSICRSGRAVQ